MAFVECIITLVRNVVPFPPSARSIRFFSFGRLITVTHCTMLLSPALQGYSAKSFVMIFLLPFQQRNVRVEFIITHGASLDC